MSQMSMKDLLKSAGFSTTDDPVIEEESNEKHVSDSRRIKDVIQRPDKQVDLLSLSIEDREVVKTQKDKTDDLIEMPRVWGGLDKDMYPIVDSILHDVSNGYLVKDNDTGEIWYAHDKLCLDRNFIYRDDLTVIEVDDSVKAVKIYWELMENVNNGQIPNKVKYILDDPGSESYELYADSAYPTHKYGKATPTGMFIHKYKDRFHRDMAVLELDALYSNSSAKQAGKLTAKKLAANEAIIISDGAWMKDTSTYCYFYLDNVSVLKQVEGVIPTEPDQAVLISEINGAYYALMQCYMRHKKKISYYYDNTSILNVFKNRKTEYIEEVKRYKEFCDKLLTEGYDVTFIELHPKTDEEKDKLNKALTYFHNTCDQECRVMSGIFKKDYKSFAGNNDSAGKTYSQVKQETKPKGRPGNGKPSNKYGSAKRY